MKKLIALMLCLVMIVSVFAACGKETPADTTAAANNTTTKAPDTTEKEPDTTVPGGDDTTEPVGGDTTTEEPINPPSVPEGPTLPEAPKTEKVDLDKLGATNAGQVEAGYTSECATGISSLSEITDLNGYYYLKGDISANDTTVIGTFKGILDGCGYTVTTSQAMFEKLAGTVMNLNVAGEIGYSVVAEAPIANELLDGAVVFNCKSTVNIVVAESTELTLNAAGFALVTSGEVVFANCEFAGSVTNIYNFKDNRRTAAGFVASAGSSDSSVETNAITLINCTVNGTVTASSYTGGAIAVLSYGNVYVYGCAVTEASVIKSTHEQYAGGILGQASGSTSIETEFINCCNWADISGAVAPAKSRAGGIVGNMSNSGGVSMSTFKWCTNFGDITSTYYAAGIVSENNTYAEYTGCVNFGTITVNDPFSETDMTTPTAANNYAGGIVAYQYENTKNLQAPAVFVDCLNYGDVSVGNRRARAGGIAGHFEAIGASFENCVNFGDVTAKYKSVSANDADCRLGGITGGGTAGFTVKNCVNFGDVTVSFHKRGQPVGGILAYTPNRDSDAQNILENCINYGTINAVAVITDSTDGTEVGGIVGMFQNSTNPAIVKNCVNVGMLDGAHRINDLISQHPATPATSYTFANNWYIENAYTTPERPGAVYGPYGYGDQLYGDELGATATSFTKATLVDQTTAGLAALINTKAEATVYTYAEVTMPDGVTVVKGIIPTAVVDLIS